MIILETDDRPDRGSARVSASLLARTISPSRSDIATAGTGTITAIAGG
jgi:hypothetical protein